MSATDGAKRELRGVVRARVEALSTDERRARAERIAAHVVESDEFARAPEVIGFVALPDEPDVSAVLRRAGELGKRVALPRIEGEGVMSFRWVGTLDDLVPGPWGLLEPPASAERVESPDPGALLLVPGVAFDPGGHRLGRGKGYYDRALAADGWSEVVALGVCFAAQIVERVPRADHDRPVRMIVTEAGVLGGD